MSRRAHIIGLVVSDTTIDTSTAADNVTANSWNRRPIRPPMNNRGMNTATSEILMDSTVNPTSRAPRNAACIGAMPSSMWRETFSSTTMASSTTNPVEIVNAINEKLSRL